MVRARCEYGRIEDHSGVSGRTHMEVSPDVIPALQGAHMTVWSNRWYHGAWPSS